MLTDQLKILFPDGDDEGAFIVPALDTRSQVLSIKDRRNGVGKPVFKLASLGSGQSFILVAPDLCVPDVSTEVLQRILSQASTANVWMAAFSPPRLFAAWRVEAPFSAASLFGGLCNLPMGFELGALFDSERCHARCSILLWGRFSL